MIHAIHSSPRTAIDISSDIVFPPDGINVVAIVRKGIIDTGLGSLRETTPIEIAITTMVVMNASRDPHNDDETTMMEGGRNKDVLV